MPRSPALPYTIDRAVTDEAEFWRHIGALIDEAVEKAIVKHGLPDATKAMQAVLRTQATLIGRVNEVASAQHLLAAAYDRLNGWCTVKGADDDLLRMRLDKFFELVTPKQAPPTPPEPPP